MKTMNKALALILALAIVMSLGITAFAATGNSITIKNAPVGATYKLYRALDIESIDGNKVSYIVNAEWSDTIKKAFKADSDIAKYLTVADDYYVTQVTTTASGEAWAKGFADAFAKFIAANNVSANKSVPVTGTTGALVDLKIDNLPLGYYYIDTETGALCIVKNNNENVTVAEKNPGPTVEKTVKEGESYGEKSDASIGDTVTYQTKITVKNGAKDYKLVDTMKTGLTFDGISKVTVTYKAQDKGKAKTLTASTDYTITATPSNGFTIVFDNKTFSDEGDGDTVKLVAGDVIYVDYTATLNADAFTQDTGAINEVKMNYGDSSKFTSGSDETHTYTAPLNIVKYETIEGKKVALAGAKFELHKGTKSGTKVGFAAASDSGEYTVGGDVTEIVSPASGKMLLKGLDAGTYYLVETAAPKGYNKITDDIKIVIARTADSSANKDSFTVTVNGVLAGSTDLYATKDALTADSVASAVAVENKSGNKLPETGGMGTTIFYTVGAVMMAGALVLLITKKKMSVN